MLDELVPIISHSAGENHFDTLYVRTTRATSFFRSVEFDDALAEVQKIKPLIEKQLEPVTKGASSAKMQEALDYVLACMRNHADRFEKQGDHSKATTLRRAME